MPTKVRWVHLDPHGPSLGFIWLRLDSPGHTWIHSDSLGLTLLNLFSRGLIWIHLYPLGFTWTHLDSLGFIWIHSDWEIPNVVQKRVQSEQLQKHLYTYVMLRINID